MKFINKLTLLNDKLPKYTAFKGDFKITIDKSVLFQCIKTDNKEFNQKIKERVKNLINHTDNKNILTVTHNQRLNLGRFYPDKSISTICLSRHVKHTLFKKMNWLDLDMIKGHPSILYSLFLNYGYELTAFKHYIENTDEIFNMLLNYYALDETLTKDNIKNIFNIGIYGGNFNTWLKNMNEKGIELKTEEQHTFITEFLNECKEASNIIYKNNTELRYNLNKNRDEIDEWKLKNSVMSYFCGAIENEMLHIAYKFLIKEKVLIARKNVELEYDGLCFIKPDSLTFEEIDLIVEKLNERIYEETLLNVKFKIKPYADKHVHFDIIEKAKAEPEPEPQPEADAKPEENDKYIFISEDAIYESDTYKKHKSEFEQTYFKLSNPLCYINEDKDGDILFYKPTQIDELLRDLNLPTFLIRNKHQMDRYKSFIVLWKDDPKKRRYDKIVFEPNPAISNKNLNNYNLFKGFKNDDDDTNPINENDSYFFKLLKHLCSAEPETYEILKSYISHIIQKPYKKTEIGLVLYSKMKGVGKDSLLIALSNIIGSNYYATINSIEDITKNFNSHLINKFVIYGDEITANAKKVADKLKSVITKTTSNLEKKGYDSVPVQDYSNYIFSTNNENAFKIEEGCRRFLMIRCPEIIPDQEFFNNFYNEISDEVKIKQIFKFFKIYANDKIIIGSGRVYETKYKKEALLENKTAYIQAIFKQIRQYANLTISSLEFYEMTKLYAVEKYLSSNYTINEFGLVINKIFSKFKLRKSSGYVFKFGSTNEIKECLYHYDNNYYRYINNLNDDEILDFNNDKSELFEIEN